MRVRQNGVNDNVRTVEKIEKITRLEVGREKIYVFTQGKFGLGILGDYQKRLFFDQHFQISNEIKELELYSQTSIIQGDKLYFGVHDETNHSYLASFDIKTHEFEF